MDNVDHNSYDGVFEEIKQLIKHGLYPTVKPIHNKQTDSFFFVPIVFNSSGEVIATKEVLSDRDKFMSVYHDTLLDAVNMAKQRKK